MVSQLLPKIDKWLKSEEIWKYKFNNLLFVFIFFFDQPKFNYENITISILN